MTLGIAVIIYLEEQVTCVLSKLRFKTIPILRVKEEKGEYLPIYDLYHPSWLRKPVFSAESPDGIIEGILHPNTAEASCTYVEERMGKS